MKVLFIIDHAPDYREAFFRELGKKVDLTVAAQPCETDGLDPPDKRIGYRYLEFPSIKFKGFYWQPGLLKLVYNEYWEVLCVDLNVRHLTRSIIFFAGRHYWDRWIWWGHIFGLNTSKILDKFKKYLLAHGAGCLTYSEGVAIDVRNKYGIEACNFNNTQVSENEFKEGFFHNHSEVRLLFVGRYQHRKRLERLVQLATRRSDVFLRLIGPGMEELEIPHPLFVSGQIRVFPRTIGDALKPHFDWADLVTCPGDVGLLVMHAAQHGKGIVIDDKSNHGPEYWLAKEAGQPFINFNNNLEVDKFIDDIKKNRYKLSEWGKQIQDIGRGKYTIEAMAEIHLMKFKEITRRQ